MVEEALWRHAAALEQNRHRNLLEERAARQAREFEARRRELSSLNRMFRAELSARFTAEEGADREDPGPDNECRDEMSSQA